MPGQHQPMVLMCPHLKGYPVGDPGSGAAEIGRNTFGFCIMGQFDFPYILENFT